MLAGIGTRFVALLLDSIIVGIVTSVVSSIFGAIFFAPFAFYRADTFRPDPSWAVSIIG